MLPQQLCLCELSYVCVFSSTIKLVFPPLAHRPKVFSLPSPALLLSSSLQLLSPLNIPFWILPFPMNCKGHFGCGPRGLFCAPWCLAGHFQMFSSNKDWFKFVDLARSQLFFFLLSVIKINEENSSCSRKCSLILTYHIYRHRKTDPIGFGCWQGMTNIGGFSYLSNPSI